MIEPITILIADDENLVRKGISHILSSQPNYKVIAEASNGKEAVDLANELEPNVILMDVRMPLMDGLQALQQIHDLQLPVYPIILSGYSDFAYAQKAMRLGAYEYLLKPADPEELIEVLGRVRCSILKDKEQKIITGRLKRQLSYSQQALVEKFFNELIHSEYTPSEIEERMNLLDIREKNATVLLLGTDNWYQLKAAGYKDKEKYAELNNNIRLCIQEFLDKENLNEVPVLLSEQGCFVLVLYSSCMPNSKQFASDLKAWVSKKTEMSFSIAIGTQESIINLHASYASASSRLKSRIMIGHNVIIEDDCSHSNNWTAYPSDKLDKIEKYIKLGNSELVQEYLAEMLDEITALGGFTPEIWSRLCLDIIEMCYRAAKEFNLVHLVSVMDKLPEIAILTTEADIRLWINTYVMEVTEKISESGPQLPWEIKNALTYIDEHFAEALSLSKVALHVGLSPNYLGQILKQHTGKKFTEYLTAKRMHEAKILLNMPDLNISEISFRIGYGSQRYFSQVFTKEEGMTPTEYRRKIHKSTT